MHSAGEAVTIEEALQQSVGEFGLGQFRIYTLVNFVWGICAMQVLIMVFSERDPIVEQLWKCTSHNDDVCMAVFDESDSTKIRNGFCKLRPGQWEWEHRDYSLVSDFNFACESWKMQLVKSGFFLGVLIGAGVLGYMSDKMGRRTTIYLSTLLAGTAMLLSSVAPSYWWYFAARVVIGLGFGGEGAAAFVLVIEITGPSKRGKAGIGTQFMFAFGECLLALLAFLIPSWRHLTLVVSLISMSFFFTMPWVPESPRWLLVNGRKGEATSVLAAIASCNRTKLPEAPLKDMAGMTNTDRALVDIVKHNKLRGWLTIVLTTWLIICNVYYGISLVLDSIPGSLHMNFFLTSVVEFPSYILFILLVDRVGRRSLYAGGFLIGGASCLLLIFAPKDLKLALAIVGKFASAGVFNLAFLYTTEIFPTVVRNAVLGASSLSSRIGGIIAPQVALLGHVLGSGIPFLIFGVSGIFAGVISYALPETLGVPLADTIEDVGQSSSARRCNCFRWTNRKPVTSYSKLEDG